MPDLLRQNLEIVELEVHRSSPFEFDATAVSSIPLNISTTTVTRPNGSWVLIEGALHPANGLSSQFPPVPAVLSYVGLTAQRARS
jgi:hypothetical protein